MKLLKDRHELALAMNFGKYPVLRIDLAEADDYGLVGSKVRIAAGTFRDGNPHIVKAQLRVYRDEKKLTTFHGCIGLSADFTYYDYVEMAENAMAPLIHPDEDVVIAVYDSRDKTPYAAILAHTGTRVDSQCSCPLSFESVDMSQYLKAAGIFD